MNRLLKIFLITLVVLVLIVYFYILLPVWGIPFNAKRHDNPPLTPMWALECWLWEDDENTAARVDELLTGYREHDIPVRTILLDSPWSLRYNDYQVDTVRYPHPEQWFPALQDSGYRVVLWTTSMVNSYSQDTRIRHSEKWYAVTRDSGYLCGGGNQFKWWKGKGGFIDYTHPAAMHWWHGLQQQVFDLGIDGWKLDGTATNFSSRLGPVPLFYQRTHKGLMTTRQYMDHYYRDEYAYGLTKNPQFVTLSRAMDRWYHPEGFAPVDASPVNWVGDQEHYWVSDEQIDEKYRNNGKDIALKGIQGFESAIHNILRSAEKGYNIIGSDVAGFSGRHIPPRLYIRWAQFSAFCGLFLNGGHGERALWKRTPQEMEIIREYAWLHNELVPYMYHYVVTGHRGGPLLMTPVKGDHQYLFGEWLLSTPIYKDDLSRKITLPEGKWRYWFDDRMVIEGPVTFTREFPLEEYPLYVREGAIIPANVSHGYTGLGDTASAGYLTLLIWPDRENSFDIFREGGEQKTTVTVKKNTTTLTITLTGEKLPHILRIHLPHKPASVTLDGCEINDQTTYNPLKQKMVIHTRHYSKGRYIIFLSPGPQL
jgi:alpha-glucosidase (family GH31 glycosyl hydrolase)